MKLTTDGIDLRKYGSQGQQRTAALALKLAELRIIKEETGEDAILLLDDVLSELDHERQNFLIRSFAENQLLITAADLSERILGELPVGKVFQVKEGRVTEEKGGEWL
jgi:DNA replication and repair protein RecF